MTRLDSWLRRATRHLSQDSADQVRAEIQEHYESAFEAAVSGGATPNEADQKAVTELGDPSRANCQYRNVLLTAAEARLLREGNWEARAFCSRPWLKWALVATSMATLSAAAALFLAGANGVARALLVGGVGLGFLFGAPLLPIYTPSRSRIFRGVKLCVIVAMPALILGPEALKWSWLLVSCLWPVVWVEWTRASIRRKLRVTEWPRQLYL